MDDNYTYAIADKIVSVLTGQASQEELTVVRQWLAESAENRKLYDELAGIWGTCCAVGRKDDYQPDVAWTLLRKQMKTPVYRPQRPAISLRKVMLVAVMIVVVFLAGMSVNLFSDQPVDVHPQLTYTEYSSPYGSKSKVKLPDGSSVWLNAGSTLRYSSAFNVQNREVFLEGEGYFDVKRNERTPFLVQTSTIAVKVLGTAFNVKAYPEEAFVETTVEHGSVQLIDPLSDSQENTILRARQKAVVTKDVQHNAEPARPVAEGHVQKTEPVRIIQQNYIPIANVEVNSNVKIELYTSWKDTRWVIEREKLSNFAVKLERRYNVRFVFVDEELKDDVFSGKFEDETLDQLLDALKLTAPILYRVKQNTVYLSRNRYFINSKMLNP